ncbi:hypothetical protein Anapl_17612 [Anas platyrhynchos]|uniref:Uncharacterized protein n=1 Tax=Anas platyrhynchos TaxID=8839 RepID=R0L683_ANAPL|nr:hypothetical protein Anapl_17612 [Anas platyrhynchos]
MGGRDPGAPSTQGRWVSPSWGRDHYSPQGSPPAGSKTTPDAQTRAAGPGRAAWFASHTKTRWRSRETEGSGGAGERDAAQRKDHGGSFLTGAAVFPRNFARSPPSTARCLSPERRTLLQPAAAPAAPAAGISCDEALFPAASRARFKAEISRDPPSEAFANSRDEIAQRANREHHFNVTRKRHAAIATFFETVVADARIISRFSEEVKPACCFSELILGGCCKWNIKKLRQGYPELKMQTAGQEHPSPLQSRTLRKYQLKTVTLPKNFPSPRSDLCPLKPRRAQKSTVWPKEPENTRNDTGKSVQILRLELARRKSERSERI